MRRCEMLVMDIVDMRYGANVYSLVNECIISFATSLCRSDDRKSRKARHLEVVAVDTKMTIRIANQSSCAVGWRNMEDERIVVRP